MKERIIVQIRFKLFLAVCLLVASVSPLSAQQKGQWLPGQIGLNAGILPDPGFTYVNMEVNYDTSTVNTSAGNGLTVKGGLSIWAIENIFEYVPDVKVLGGNIGFMVMFPTLANGSLTVIEANFSQSSWGFADLWLQPFTMGWHKPRFDFQVAEAILAPIGRYHPGATTNTGTGYWGNHLTTGTTGYLTKNKGTSINYFTDWEVHSDRQGSYTTFKVPGQAFSQEWGLGQVLPIAKDMSKLLQVGVVGYDQWQITNNSGTFAIAVPGSPGTVLILPASAIPHYSVHAVGGQLNFIMPKSHFAMFFKYYHEYSSYAHTLGNTVVFGGTITLPHS